MTSLPTKLVIFFIALGAAITALFMGYEATHGGHTNDESHCNSSPRLCVFVYVQSGIDKQHSFRINDKREASLWDSEYERALDNAEFQWSKAAGPQAPTEPDLGPTLLQDLPSLPNTYWNCPDDGDPENLCALTGSFVCLRPLGEGFDCSPGDRSIDITGAQTWIDDDVFMDPDTNQNALIAHELGHVVGLNHHDHLDCLMQLDPLRVGPGACDLGEADPFDKDPAPCDGIALNWGVRCIFNFWREQPLPAQGPPGTITNCGDLNRDNNVNIPFDILPAAVSFGPLGEAKSHPDADINVDGFVNIPDDILGIARQFGDECTVAFDHYDHS